MHFGILWYGMLVYCFSMRTVEVCEFQSATACMRFGPAPEIQRNDL